MRRALKWAGIVLGGLVGLVVLAAVGIYVFAEVRLNRAYATPPLSLSVPTDSAAVARGRHWASVHCLGCHGEDLGGKVVFEDASLGRISGGNLTSGKGGVGKAYSDADWARAIRGGVRSDGKPLAIMPSKDLFYLSDGDLADIIAYVKSIPPVDREMGKRALTPLAHVLFVAGAFGDMLAAEAIDHSATRPDAPSSGVSVAYGAYLAQTGGCRGCHGAELSGGKSAEPGAPPGPNLTPAGGLASWSEGDFVTAMHTGVRPQRGQMSDFMPWKYMGRMSDGELKALWLYLKSVPAKASTAP